MIPPADRVVRILGIDSSTACTGFAVLDFDRETQAATVVATYESAPRDGCEIVQRTYLAAVAASLVRKYDVRMVATEKAFGTVNAEVFQTLTEFRASIEDACYAAGASVFSIAAARVKAALGLRNSDDKKIVGPHIVMERFGIAVGDDVADAIGAGLALGPQLRQREEAA